MPRKSRPAVLLAISAIGAAVALQACGGPDADRSAQPVAARSTPSPSPAPDERVATWRSQLGLPVEVGGDLWVGGEQVPGEWWGVQGRGTRWIGVHPDRTWWWGNDARPHRMEGEVDQGPAISPSGRYVAYVVGSGRRWTLDGVDTETGDGLGTLELPSRAMDPAPRAVGVSDDGLVVVQGPDFQWVWRPLVDGGTVDLAETAPGQVVLDVIDAGLVVNEGQYGRTDPNVGAPYLARLSADGTLARLGSLPRHDVLEAGETWLAFVAPGSIGGEAWGTSELRVQHLDGSGAGVIAAPDGWLFAAPGFRWETADQLVAPLLSPDGGREALARCRPDRMTCELVDLPD